MKPASCFEQSVTLLSFPGFPRFPFPLLSAGMDLQGCVCVCVFSRVSDTEWFKRKLNWTQPMFGLPYRFAETKPKSGWFLPVVLLGYSVAQRVAFLFHFWLGKGSGSFTLSQPKKVPCFSPLHLVQGRWENHPLTTKPPGSKPLS